MSESQRRTARAALPAALLAAALRPGAGARQRAAAAFGLVSLWSVVYLRYRQRGRQQTATELELLRSAHQEAFKLHYNERVPTVHEEFELWGPYHQHRHEMRYDLVAAEVRRHLPGGGLILDIGCGAGLVAERLADRAARYVGTDFGGHHIDYAAKRMEELSGAALSAAFVRGDAERLPFGDGVADVVVLSEVIEHLLRPELAVWEIARVLRPGGVMVMTTNNASEAPLRSPLSHLFAWVEKALGADHPALISLRPWVWPEPVDRRLLGLGEGDPDVYLPHTHHIQAETRRLFAAAGLETVAWSSFEFPPPQAATSAWLEARGGPGRRAVDVLEAVATRTPGIRRLGCHLLMVVRKVGDPVAASPPPGVWPGPFSP
ncbi:MAG TPA: class I SAM-dependent methyltransferase [Acidimicrobiales bacterium]|nr:class I SAM-dependent methyltransferase [Acidimicrobiales bacterium]